MAARTGRNSEREPETVFIAGPQTSRSALLGGVTPSTAYSRRQDHIYSSIPKPSVESLTKMLLKCGEAMDAIYCMERDLVELQIITEGRVGGTALIELECQMLDLASTTDLCSEVFYAFVLADGVDNKQCFVRFFEAGLLEGFFEAQGQQILSEKFGMDILPYRIFSKEDETTRQKHLATRHSKVKGRSRPAQTFNRKMHSDKGSVEKLMITLKNVFEKLGSNAKNQVKGIFAVARKKCGSLSSNDMPFFQWGMDSFNQRLQQAILDYSLASNHQPQVNTIDLRNLDQASLPQITSLKDQLSIISMLPNAFWTHGSHVSFIQRLSWKEHKSKYPFSIRNQIIFCMNEDGKKFESRQKDLSQLCKQFIFDSLVTNENATETGDAAMFDDEPNNNVTNTAQLAKRRRTVNRIKAVNEDVINNELAKGGCDNVITMTVYQNYVKNLLDEGFFVWRYSSSDCNIILLNDIDDKKGEFNVSSFCHVIVRSEGDEDLLSCNCSVYKLLQQLVFKSERSTLTLDMENIVLDSSTTCVHCRVVKDYFLPIKNDSNRLAQNAVEKKLQDSIEQYRNVGAVQIGSSRSYDTIKFSVLNLSEGCEFVHLSRGGIRLICQSGICNLQMKQARTKLVRNLLALDPQEASCLCPHLFAMKACSEQWLKYLPGSQPSQVDITDEEIYADGAVIIDGVLADNEVNGSADESFIEEQDITMDTDSRIGFKLNQDGGMWDFGGLSTHKPTSSRTDKLNRNVQKRQKIRDGDYGRDSEGYLIGGLLSEPFVPECQCQAGFMESDVLDNVSLCRQYSKDTIVYTKQGPVKYTICERHCQNATNPCIVNYTGETDSIHFWTEETAMADEIGYSYLSLLFGSGQSFSSFCLYMCEEYSNINKTSAKFMSNTTFVNCMFSWLGRMKIDFRKYIDPFCEYQPTVLACDATHAGVAFRSLNMQAIETSDMEEEIQCKHRRYNRVFLCDDFVKNNSGVAVDDVRQARQHLKYISKKTASDINRNEVLAEDEEQQRNNHLIRVVGNRAGSILIHFIEKSYDAPLLQPLTRLFYLLSSDAPLTAFIPYAQCSRLRNAVDAIVESVDVERNLNTVCNIFPELKPVLKAALASSDRDILDEMKQFVKHLCDRIEQCHGDDPPINEDRLVNSYNPETGVAYYFTEQGDQVRKLRKYEADKNKKSTIYDEEPMADEKCSKRFPTAGQMGGYCNLFLWFCPEHGHSYGFHLIPNHEGRKDAFSSLYKYLPSPPSHIYYDFACSLSEYCLNREPAYFRDVHFCHDIFHGYSHKCSGAFKANRTGQMFVNTSICEQFNSYLKRVKFVASHLSQAKYIFLLQYALYVWNERKTAAYKERLNIALASVKQ